MCPARRFDLGRRESGTGRPPDGRGRAASAGREARSRSGRAPAPPGGPCSPRPHPEPGGTRRRSRAHRRGSGRVHLSRRPAGGAVAPLCSGRGPHHSGGHALADLGRGWVVDSSAVVACALARERSAGESVHRTADRRPSRQSIRTAHSRQHTPGPPGPPRHRQGSRAPLERRFGSSLVGLDRGHGPTRVAAGSGPASAPLDTARHDTEAQAETALHTDAETQTRPRADAATPGGAATGPAAVGARNRSGRRDHTRRRLVRVVAAASTEEEKEATAAGAAASTTTTAAATASTTAAASTAAGAQEHDAGLRRWRRQERPSRQRVRGQEPRSHRAAGTGPPSGRQRREPARRRPRGRLRRPWRPRGRPRRPRSRQGPLSRNRLQRRPAGGTSRR